MMTIMITSPHSICKRKLFRECLVVLNVIAISNSRAHRFACDIPSDAISCMVLIERQYRITFTLFKVSDDDDVGCVMFSRRFSVGLLGRESCVDHQTRINDNSRGVHTGPLVDHEWTLQWTLVHWLHGRWMSFIDRCKSLTSAVFYYFYYRPVSLPTALRPNWVVKL